jgi:hypothetical protein
MSTDLVFCNVVNELMKAFMLGNKSDKWYQFTGLSTLSFKAVFLLQLHMLFIWKNVMKICRYFKKVMHMVDTSRISLVT